MVSVVAAVAVEDDVDELIDSASSAWTTFVEALPRVGIASVVLILFVVVGRLMRPLVRRRLARRRTPSFAQVFSRLTSAGMVVAGTLFAATIVFPSVRPVDLLAGAGVLSVAVGFAFQDILQNLLAGVLLLFRQPFRSGDQVQVGDVAGTVEEINVRETVIRTYDGRRVLVPNATVYTDVIEVRTARPNVRNEFTVGISYDADLQEALTVITDAVRGCEGVADDPAPEALVAELAPSAVAIDVLFWCDAHQLELRRTTGRVLAAVKLALDEHGIEIPYEILTLRTPT